MGQKHESESERGNHCRALGNTEREHFHRVERKEMMRQISMGRLGALCAVGLVLFANLAWAQDPSEPIPGVIDLDPTNVKEVLNGMKITIAEFYAPWCGHCRSLGEPFSVTGFPTLKILSRGIGVDEADTAFDYSGPRDAESMFAKLKGYVEDDKKVGRNFECDAIAADFMKAGDKGAFAADAKDKVEAHLGGDLYHVIMEKIIKKGDEYPTKESARLARIIAKGSITRTKFADMVLKQNVLDAFIEGTPTETS